MKNHRRKRRKKGKALQSYEKETLSEAIEFNPLKEVREMKPGNLQFNLACADHYSLYERTSVREETSKESTNTELVLGDGIKETKRELKGEPKSVLPPLKEGTQRPKQLTFAGKRRACEHSILDTREPVEARNVDENSQKKTSTCSESQKKLASLSFVGIYDLDDMGKTETNKEEKLESILKSGKQRDQFGISPEENGERVEESSERTKRYVIQTLTLEGQSPLRRTTLFQEKLLLPDIKQNALSTRPHKIFDDEFKTSKRRQRLLRESENRLPNIVQSVNRTPKISPRSYRGKLRKRDNSFKQVYLEGNIPRLPLIVNGRMSHS